MVVVGAVGDSGLLKLVKGFGLNLIDTRSDCARKEAVQGIMKPYKYATNQ